MTRIARPLAIFAIAALAPTASAQGENAPNQANNDTTAPANDEPAFVTFETTAGDFTVLIDREHAPITSEHILRLVRDDFYDGLIIHRVLPISDDEISIVQAGAFTPDLTVRQAPFNEDGIKNEWRNGLRNVEGTIAMARRGGEADSATTQWFINTTDNAVLDQPRDGAAYAVFGYVVEGLDNVKKISNVERTVKATRQGGIRLRNIPQQDVVIEEARVIEPESLPDDASAEAARWAERAEEMAERAAEQMRERRIQTARRQCERQFQAQLMADQRAAAERIQEAKAQRYEQIAEMLDDADPNNNGLTVVYENRGDGAPVATDDIVLIDMSFWREGEPQPVFATGVITAGEPGTARVAELPSRNIRPIDALADLVAGTPVGSKLVTRVPSEMAYGQEGVPQANIAPDTDLVFEIEIIDTIPPFESLNARLEDGSTTDSGIDFAVLALGEGETATASDTVLTTYAGWLTDGTLFDTGTLRFSADRVIPGWTESLSDMRPGEKRVVRIPGELAYGERGAGDAIPPNATLVFYIHLRDVERLSEFLDNCEPYQAALEGRAPESEDRRPQQRRFENIRRETTGNNEDSKNTGRENE